MEFGQVQDGDACRFSVEGGVGEDRSTDTDAAITRSDRNQHTVKPLIIHTPWWTAYGLWEVDLGVNLDSMATQTYGLWGCTGYER